MIHIHPSAFILHPLLCECAPGRADSLQSCRTGFESLRSCFGSHHAPRDVSGIRMEHSFLRRPHHAERDGYFVADVAE